MLSFPAAIKVYLCTVPCDLRRAFDGLSMMAEHLIPCNPFPCPANRAMAWQDTYESPHGGHAEFVPGAADDAQTKAKTPYNADSHRQEITAL